MRVILNKKNFSNIRSAVYYKSPAMPVGVTDLWNTLDPNTQTLLRSSKSLAPGMAQEIRYDSGECGVDYRFFEYGLQYFPNPEGFLPGISEGMAKTLFWDTSDPSNPIWLGTESLKNLGKFIIPTQTQNSNPSGLKFFGSFKTETQEIYVFPGAPGISKIELYDIDIKPSDINDLYDYDLGLSRPENLKPSISIYLGCVDSTSSTISWSNNIPHEYYIDGIQKDADLDYKLYSERFDRKVIFLSFSQRDEKHLPISYTAWLKLYEPLRNKPSYDTLLSESLSDPKQTGETIEGHIFDLASGSYLGSKDSRPKPILEEKLKKLQTTKNLYRQWKRYMAGEEVSYGGNSWVSLCSDNCGNTPGYSSKWVLKNRMTDFYTSWFLVKCDEAQEILPGQKIDIPDYQKESVFMIYPNPGYVPTEVSVNNLERNSSISRVVMTENIDIDEKRYYIFYVRWSSKIKGEVLELDLEKKPLEATVMIPAFIINPSGSEYELRWNQSDVLPYDIKIPGKSIFIDEPMDASIITDLFTRVNLGKGLNLSSTEKAKVFSSFMEKIKFSIEYEKSIPGKVWGTGESKVEPSYSASYSPSGILTNFTIHENSVDYEVCKYILVPSWRYRKVTVSNSGDFDVEYPVQDVINTENYKSGIYSRKGLVPSEIMVKYRTGDSWSEWQHVSFDGNYASWFYFKNGSGDNSVHLSRTDTNLYELQVNSVITDLIIDIKV